MNFKSHILRNNALSCSHGFPGKKGISVVDKFLSLFFFLKTWRWQLVKYLCVTNWILANDLDCHEKVGLDSLGGLFQPGRFGDSIKWVVLLHFLMTVWFSSSLSIFFMVQYHLLLFIFNENLQRMLYAVTKDVIKRYLFLEKSCVIYSELNIL